MDPTITIARGRTVSPPYCQAPTDFFSDDQYLLADSAFTATTTVVPAFKRARNRGLTEEQHDFNRHLSGVRVGIENFIGLFKNRFESLKGRSF
ncbi:hypothetical protein PSTG_20168 [Puccinia striiformis f. sp. tritici PST-78]|uniref:DDE Tnp4 domain-containing protein n=1 Tax=Puccinia striiformis f. sp. tritici PST-78 TaxID=1165861 RepID=A0A0L0UHE3_9BASI|nr:hypothetical protein PSTG_20168 [Puccinia striiformis f. sp. tritici PST-78]